MQRCRLYVVWVSTAQELNRMSVAWVEGDDEAERKGPLAPVTLDRLTVADDPDYKTTLNGERNLPEDFKTALVGML